MLLASLALAFLTTPQAAPAADDGPVKTWENVDVMRRMLVRQIGAKHDAISVAPKKSDDGDEDTVVTTRDGKVTSAHRRPDDGSTAENTPDKPVETVAGAFTRARNFTYYESSLPSNAEYAPGLGAIVSVTVPVRVRLVTPEPKSADAKKPAETRNADDEAWEKLARGDDGRVDRRLNQLLGADGKSKDEPQRELRYEEAAVKALKETVVDTVARFGGRLGLSRGERLAVVVTLSAGGVVREEDEGSGGDKKGGSGKREAAVDESFLKDFGIPAVGDRSSGGDYFLRTDLAGNVLTLDRRTTLSGRRLVFQVSGDDLRAHKAGDLERDELARKMRIEEFTLPAGSSLGSNRFDWYRSPK
jgi:hypothetical protein